MSKNKKFYKESGKANAGKNKKAIKIAVISVLAATLAAIIGFSVYFIVKKVVNSVKPISRTEEESAVVGQVAFKEKNYDVYYDELRAITCFYKIAIAKSEGYATNEAAMNAWENKSFADRHADELKSLVTENLVNNYVNFAFCDFFAISTDSDEIDDYVQEQVEQVVEDCNGKMSEYREWLESEHMSDAYLRFALKSAYLESVAYFSLLNTGFFGFQEQDKEAFIAYVTDAESNNYCATVSILVDNKADADMIFEQLNSETDSGKRLQTMYGYVGSKYNKDNTSGNIYYFTHNEMTEKYEDVAFKLKVGDVGMSEETDDGYYIMLRIAIEKDYVTAHWEDLLDGYQSAVMGMQEDLIADEMSFTFTENGKKTDLTLIK